MNIKGHNIKIKQIVILSLLVAGLAVTLVLVKHQQILKSKANVDVNAIIIPSDENGELEYTGNNTYKTKSNTINIDLR